MTTAACFPLETSSLMAALLYPKMLQDLPDFWRHSEEFQSSQGNDYAIKWAESASQCDINVPDPHV